MTDPPRYPGGYFFNGLSGGGDEMRFASASHNEQNTCKAFKSHLKGFAPYYCHKSGAAVMSLPCRANCPLNNLGAIYCVKSKERPLYDPFMLAVFGNMISKPASRDAGAPRISMLTTTPEPHPEAKVTLKWLADQLRVGTWTQVANRSQKLKYEYVSTNQDELGLV